MKVALVGNMNNNNFSLFRYLRDAGIDTYLLLYNNELEHFFPENDSWFVEQHKPYIVQTDLQNSERGVLLSSKNKIAATLKGYDVFIGSGITPAYFAKIGKKLDLFYPYAIGIEFYQRKMNFLRPNDLAKIPARWLQKKGLKNTKICIISNVMEHETVKSYASLSIQPIPLNIPMVYNKETLDSKDVPEKLNKVLERFKEYDKVIFSHVTHRWDFEDNDGINYKMSNINRRNDKLIHGFGEFQKTSTAKNLLVMSEYGPDVPQSKAIVKALGIENNVLWLPVLGRKELMLLMQQAHLCVGELGEAGTWGGATWEFLASGKAVINRYKIEANEYQKQMGIPFPPLLNITTANDIANILGDLEKHPEKYITIGKQSKDWFDTYNGQSLTKNYVELIHKAFQSRAK